METLPQFPTVEEIRLWNTISHQSYVARPNQLHGGISALDSDTSRQLPQPCTKAETQETDALFPAQQQGKWPTTKQPLPLLLLVFASKGYPDHSATATSLYDPCIYNQCDWYVCHACSPRCLTKYMYEENVVVIHVYTSNVTSPSNTVHTCCQTSCQTCITSMTLALNLVVTLSGMILCLVWYVLLT